MEEKTMTQLEKCSAKLIKNTKGYNHEIRVVEGVSKETLAELVDMLMYANDLIITKTSELI